MDSHPSQRAQSFAKWLIILSVFALVVFALAQTIAYELRPRQMVSMGGSVFRADVATSKKEQTKGLSGRRSLGVDEAMLFVFDVDGPHPMWMKDMKFPIDMVWISSTKQVVHVESHVKPDALPYQVYESPVPARYVLEVPAGQAKVNEGAIIKLNVAEEGLR